MLMPVALRTAGGRMHSGTSVGCAASARLQSQKQEAFVIFCLADDTRHISYEAAVLQSVLKNLFC